MQMQPVLEIFAPDGFALWPTGEHERYGYLVLDGGLTPAEVGTAVWRLADCNDVDPDEDDERGPRPEDPLGAFLHGLLTLPNLFAPGGFRVTDTVTGTVFQPGCCSGLEEWRAWHEVTDGTGEGWFGHDPEAVAQRTDGIVRLLVDAEDGDSPVIELPVDELRRLLAGAEQNLRNFLQTAASWAEQQLPEQVAAVTAALARALDLGPAT
ncbi:hypothetical protein [Kitasatospora aureofaciens]|uniref:hypothetical protein n=1 Tax=Kitasatospora aureofaciens TaxID=1894 RepID=UPI0027E07DB0|nr:hypothetical protein [Kitasatospora aureofaciens]